MLAEDDDSSELVDYDNELSETSDDVLAAEGQDDDSDDEAYEVMELHKKSKDKFRRAFKSYKESKRKVKEIKKSRQSYYPVVALSQPADGSVATSSQTPLQKQPFKYDRKPGAAKGVGKKKSETKSRKEEANLTETNISTSFNYMVELGDAKTSVLSEDILLASIPSGFAIIDTGCTTSVIGRDHANRLIDFLQKHQLPLPEHRQLPPVELKGFPGEATSTTEGLVWYVQLGQIWGTITTYVIPGRTAFLLSRRVLEGMNAQLDLGAKTLTSEKHGISGMVLRQASNGHLLMPLWQLPDEWTPEINLEEHEPVGSETAEIEIHEPNAATTATQRRVQFCPNAKDCSPDAGGKSDNEGNKTPVKINLKGSWAKGRSNGSSTITRNDRRSALQHIAKHTKKGLVDLEAMTKPLKTLFGECSHEIKYAFIAYRPKLERMPYSAESEEWLRSIVTLSSDGDFHMSPWAIRTPDPVRGGVAPTNLALFAYRKPVCLTVQKPREEQPCLCCNDQDLEGVDISITGDNGGKDLEALYEEVDWVEPNLCQLSHQSADLIRQSIKSIKKTSSQLVLSRLLSEPDAVERELKAWLGDQAHKLNSQVELVEVFTDDAPLSIAVEKVFPGTAIRIGLSHGQDLSKLKDRQLLLCLIAWTKPKHVWYSWPCGVWGPWSRFNMARNSQLRADILQKRAYQKRYLHVVAEAWNLQNLLGGYNHCENPLSSDAWKELMLGDVYDCRIDQCAMGLRCPKTNLPILKPTRIVTTSRELAEVLLTCRCDQRHQHAHLEGNFRGKNLTAWAEVYPKKFCRIIAEALHRQSCQLPESNMDWSEELFAAESSQPVDAPDLDDPPDQSEQPEASEEVSAERAKAIVNKLHVNTGHSSTGQMMRLANRCQASETLKQAIKDFKCPICDELKTPPLHRKATIPHNDRPNQVVGVDYVQVELIREDEHGVSQELKFNVMTCVCLASDFAQQYIVPEGPNALSRAFHQCWVRPYGAPESVYMDPHFSTLSKDFQEYLDHNDIKLLHIAAEAHWQLGRTEIANRVLRGMAQKCWRSSNRPPEEVIEACCAIRNQQMRKCGFSPAQWFLGQDIKMAGWLGDVDQQRNLPVQSQILSDPVFADRIRLREEAAKAFIEEHAKDVWRRAICGRNRPIRGPYQVGQLVYMFRRRGRGQFKTRFGVWHGPGRVIGVESSQGNTHVPRVVWIAYNGYLYRCSPEALRPVPEDEASFRELAKGLAEGRLHPDVIQAEQSLSGSAGYKDMIHEKPEDDDMELESDVEAEPITDDHKGIKRSLEGGVAQPRKILRRITRSPEYWMKRSAGMPPLGTIQEGVIPEVITLDQPAPKRTRTMLEPTPEEEMPDDIPDDKSLSYAPSIASQQHDQDMQPDAPAVDDEMGEDNVGEPSSGSNPNVDNVEVDQSVEPAAVANDESVPRPMEEPPPEDPSLAHIPSDDEGLLAEAKLPKKPALDVLEVSIDIHPKDINDNPLCLWSVLDECLVAAPSKAAKRRVEVSLRKLNVEDKRLFEKAMQKEWQSWVENKDPGILRTCAGQLAWVSNATRPDQSFLSSYLQGVQDKGQVSHVQLYNKALREMKERRVCLQFPSHVAIEDWCIVCISDSGWGTRSSGESQGGYVLCLAHKDILERKRAPCWIIDWSSKKLKRMVRSSVAAETLAGQNGLDAIEFFQALMSETLYGITPQEFRTNTPKIPSCLVIDSKGFYDAVTRSCSSQSISVERRLMIDYAIARETIEKQGVLVFWVNNLRMVADALTKLKGDTRPLFEILEGGTFLIKLCLESGRKETAKQKEQPSPPQQ
eukprot:s19_g18.t1